MTYETIHTWCVRFAPEYARRLRGRGSSQLMSTTTHLRNRCLNNWCGNSHQPNRQRERAMKGLLSVAAAQRFLSVFSRTPHILPTPAPFDHRSLQQNRRQIPGYGIRFPKGPRCLNDGTVRCPVATENCCIPNNLALILGTADVFGGLSRCRCPRRARRSSLRT